MPVARVFLRPDRVCLLAFVVRLSTLAPSRDAILPPVLSGLPRSFSSPVGFPDALGSLLPFPRDFVASAMLLEYAFPAESFVVVVAVIVSVDSPCRCGISENPCVSSRSPLYQALGARSSRAGRRRIDRQVARPLFAGTLEGKRETREGEEGKNEGGGSKTLKRNGKGRECDEDKLRDISDGKRDGRKKDG